MAVAFVIAFLLNVYMIFLLMKLSSRSDFNFPKGFSFRVVKAINVAIGEANSEGTKTQLIKLKRTYILIVVSFFTGMILFTIRIVSLNT